MGASYAEFKDALDLPSQSRCASEYGSRLSNVMEKIKSFSIRDTKRTAGIELPEKTILTHSVELAPRQSEIYASYRDALSYEMQTENDLSLDDAEDILKRLLRLVQCASNPTLVDETYDEISAKQAKLAELIDEIDIRSNKAIIWTGFIKNVEWLSRELDYLMPRKVHGHMSVDDRNESIRRFKTNSNCRVLLATPGSAKEGLTLTVANHAIFYDRGFSLDDYLQAQDRIHRISQTEDCFVHNLIARNTIDEWVDMLLNAKYQAAQLTQGDVSREEFDTVFAHDLKGTLTELLVPVSAA